MFFGETNSHNIAKNDTFQGHSRNIAKHDIDQGHCTEPKL